MPENYKAIEIFNAVVLFLSEDMALPSCLPWLFEIYDVQDAADMFEKLKILHGILRRRHTEKMEKVVEGVKKSWQKPQ